MFVLHVLISSGMMHTGTSRRTMLTCEIFHTDSDADFLMRERIWKQNIHSDSPKQDRFLREWLEFHICSGIEHFYLFVDRPADGCYNTILQS